MIAFKLLHTNMLLLFFLLHMATPMAVAVYGTVFT